MREKIPEERRMTIRAEILSLVEGDELSVGDLSKAIGKPEKELYDHLEHLLRTKSLDIIPAKCLKCGYLFTKREKVKKPGKCPHCRGTHISQPLFAASQGKSGRNR